MKYLMTATTIKSNQVYHIYDAIEDQFGILRVKLLLKNRVVFPPRSNMYLSMNQIDEELQEKAKLFFKNKRKV